MVDPSASALTLSGTIGGFAVQQQGNGSLTSSYSGGIVADWDLDNLTINFDQGGAALSATITGDWQPKPDGTSGSAPANYGGKLSILFLTAEVAIRNLTLTTSTASPLPLSGTGPYSFPSSQTFTVLTGTADYNAGTIGTGSEDLSTLSARNTSPNPSTFEDLGNGSYRLTLPVSLTIQEMIDNQPSTLHIDGQIVATAVIPVVSLTDGTSSSFNYSTSAVGGGGPVNITDPAAAIVYTPAGNLTSMTVTLLNHPDGTAEVLGYDLDDSGLTTNGYDPSTGQLIITGSADASVYQSVLRTLTYENDSSTPDPSDRQIQIVVSDGTNSSVVRTTTVHLTAPAAPVGPVRFFGSGKGVPSEGSTPVSDSPSNSVPLTHADLIMRDLSLNLWPAAVDRESARIGISGNAEADSEIDLLANLVASAPSVLDPLK